MLIQISFQRRLLNDEGTGVGEADEVFRLVIGGSKAQSGFTVQLQLLAQQFIDAVAQGRLAANRSRKPSLLARQRWQALQQQAVINGFRQVLDGLGQR